MFVPNFEKKILNTIWTLENLRSLNCSVYTVWIFMKMYGQSISLGRVKPIRTGLSVWEGGDWRGSQYRWRNTLTDRKFSIPPPHTPLCSPHTLSHFSSLYIVYFKETISLKFIGLLVHALFYEKRKKAKFY